jgi:Ni/Co efflux regulator RcnB
MEASKKLTFPGIALAALIVASPAALAQNTGYSGTTSKPGASVAKDDQMTGMTKHSKKHTASYSKKKHTASYKHWHHAKAMNSKAQTTGSGSSSAPGASIKKDDTAPKSR